MKSKIKYTQKNRHVQNYVSIKMNTFGCSLSILELTGMEKNNTRNSGIELLRILSMLMILSHHYVNFGIVHGIHGKQYDFWANGSVINRAFSALLQPGGRIGVAVFFLITGYFGIHKKAFDGKKVFAETFYYGFFGVFILLLSHLFGTSYARTSFSTKAILLAKSVFIANSSGIWWFATTYLILLIIAPWINEQMKKIQKNKQLLMLFILFCTIHLLDSLLSTPFSNLYRATFFYCVGAFLRLNPDAGVSRIDKKWSIIIAVLGWLFASLLYFEMNTILVNETPIRNQLLYVFWDAICMAIPCLICPIMLLLFFAKDSFFNPFINTIAKSTFGVYLIHEYPATRWLIWKDLLKVDTWQYNNALFPLLAVFSVVLCFAVCILLDLVRAKVFEKKMLEMLDRILTWFY